MTDDQLRGRMDELLDEARSRGHNLGPGWEVRDVLGTGFHRLECMDCHDVVYLWPNGMVLPMTFDRCRGKSFPPDLKKD